jgi:LmbE family N-acetylglucosaminyl deacetylase
MQITEIEVYSNGTLPKNVQRWENTLSKCDILITSTHSDDDTLFFGALAAEQASYGRMIQTVFVCNHSNELHRLNELLDGQWTLGITAYPIFGEFEDFYSMSLAKAQEQFDVDALSDFLVSAIRRTRPKVVITHDVNGEYGHGAHVLVATALTEVITYSEDPTKFPESAEKYGLWTPKKTYLHLYEENQIVMDWDTPYDSLGGKTPFEMSQIGFGYHKSQHWTWFYPWIYGKNGKKITKATEIEKFSPCNYGLYQTSVGEDVLKNDFTENIVPYDLQTDIEEEEIIPPEESKPETEEAVSEAVSENESVAEQKDESENNGLYIWLAVLLTVSIISVIVVCFMPRKRKFR